MFQRSGQIVFIKRVSLNVFRSFRSVRSVAHRDNVPKAKGYKIKTVTSVDDRSRIKTYEDFVNDMNNSNFGDELEAEKYLAEEENHGEAIERCHEYFDYYSSQEKSMKKYIKKNIVQKKYFKLDQETNLLTYAAKEQIRSLHKSDPLEWNYKTISECFPISEAGAKKLLKCNFVLKHPEAIKAHDEQVAERWKILKSGKITSAIAPLTWKLYKEGKLVDDYFSGNSNLPTAPPPEKVVHVQKKKEIGEFSAIVQAYVNYRNQKCLPDNKEITSENQLSLRDNSKKESKNKSKAVRKFKYADEELDDKSSSVKPTSKIQVVKEDIPLSQFKEILKEEYQSKSHSYPDISKYEDYEHLLKENAKNESVLHKQKSSATQDCFVNISKYDKTEKVNAMYESRKKEKIVYMYDENVGYQHIYRKQTKHLSPKKLEKGKLHKVGQCVYDDNGEFLYKIMS